MKVLMLNGSPRANGCTYTALMEIGAELNRQGIDYEIFQIGDGPMYDCLCSPKSDDGEPVKFDLMDEFIEKAKTADGFIVGSPVYFAHPSGRLMAFMERFSSMAKKYMMHKPATAIASARRAGTTATLDVINKHFSYACMPIVPSTYWNMVHGHTPADVMQDLEGLQIMRNVGKNMAWMLKCFEAGKNAGIEIPEMDTGKSTSFIR